MKIDLSNTCSTITKQLSSQDSNNNIKDSLSPYTIIQKITQNMIDLNFLLDSDVLSVADITSFLFEFSNSIENLKNIININIEDINKIKEYYLNLKNNRKAGDILSEGEKKKMKKDLEIASKVITKQLSS